MKGSEGIDLSCPGCCSTDVNGSNSAFFTKNHGATGQGLEVTGMTNLDPRDICNSMRFFHSWGYYQKGRNGVNDHGKHLFSRVENAIGNDQPKRAGWPAEKNLGRHL
jgi:hypothetical protein